MFNPEPRLSVLRLGAGHTVVVADEFLLEPLALVDAAKRHVHAFAPTPQNAFPGPELPLPESAMAGWSAALSGLAASSLGQGPVRRAFGRLSLVTLQAWQLAPVQRVCHRDRLDTSAGEASLASVVYLFDNPRLGGTAFFVPRGDAASTEAFMRATVEQGHEWLDQQLPGPRGYMLTSNAHFECVGVVPAAFNRAIFYRGSGFHTSHIEHPELLSVDPAQGRLTMNGFFVCAEGSAAVHSASSSA
jgi:hypothetical protein